MNMFKDSGAKTVEDYLAAVPEERQEIMRTVHQIILEAIPEQKAHMLSGMVAYGSYPYKTKSGPAGEWAYVLISNRKDYVSVYVCAVKDGNYIAESNKDRLGKVSVGKSCIRFKKLEDINMDVLSELCKEAVKLGGLSNFGQS